LFVNTIVVELLKGNGTKYTKKHKSFKCTKTQIIS